MPSTLAATQTERGSSFASSAMILRALVDGVVIVDLSGDVCQVNPAAAVLLGVDEEALLHRRVEDLLGGAPLKQEDGEVDVAGRALRFQKQSLTSDDDPGRVVGSMIILSDTSARRAAKRQQYEFISRALHDVRVPLQAMSGSAEGLLRGWFGPLNDEQREFVSIIKENADHQGDLFGKLFDVYALAANHIQLHSERLQVDGVIHEVAHEFAARFDARTIHLALDMADDLPPALADRQRLRQIVVALFENAYKYTFPGGTVEVRARRRDGELCVEIQDSGVGIRAADQPHVFTPFFRGDSPLREGRYGGLSLAITRMLVALHGGRIWFESVEGQGSTFYVTLPLADEPAGE
ncbi:MAG TPA: PAS domain-containing sensor histidine kinase [Roseiflexaceae bacterium]